MNKKFIFLDLDGTTIDVKSAQNKGAEAFYKLYKFYEKTDANTFIQKWNEFTEYHYEFYVKKEISHQEQRVRRIISIFEYFNIPLTKEPLEVYDDYLKEFEANWKVFDDVSETLTELKNRGYKLGIISNGKFEQQVKKLKKVKIFDMFDCVFTSSQFEVSKPNPKLFENIFNKLSLNYAEVCYIGDDLKKDILPCKAIGVDAIFVNRSGADVKEDIVQVQNLTQVISEIQKLEQRQLKEKDS